MDHPAETGSGDSVPASPGVGNHRKLGVWRKSYALAKSVYVQTRTFPKDELYGLTSQMRRAAVSIPCNDFGIYRAYWPKQALLKALDPNRKSCWP